MRHLSEIDSTLTKKTLTKATMISLALMPYFLVKEIERMTGRSDLLLMAIGLKSEPPTSKSTAQRRSKGGQKPALK